MEPYRLAMLSHVPLNGPDYADLFGEGNHTLDHFSISYAQPLFGTRRLLDAGYEVVCLYSSFGRALVKEVGDRIVLVRKTDADIVRALLHAREFGPSAVLSVNENEDIDIALLERLCEVRIRPVRYDSVDTLVQGNAAAYEDGERVFVGGGVSAFMKDRDGVTYVPIVPSRHSVLQALERAEGLARAYRDEEESRGQLMAILRLFPGGVLCVNGEGDPLLCNDGAYGMLGVERGNTEGLQRRLAAVMVPDVLDDGQPRDDVIVQVDGRQLVVTTLPVMLHADARGAVAFLQDADALRTTSDRLHERRSTGFRARYRIDDFKGTCSETMRLRNMARLYARHSVPVLIHGETGTGKEVLAQAMHNAGPRRNAPFVALNCAALPDSLLESELFGYEEGAFTGARKGGKPGIFEMAHKGTVLLDEIGDMSASAQLRLLRTLETREVMRIGGKHMIPVDIRVISASHRPLHQLVSEGGFRQDLFYRLAVLRMNIPPLRQRLDDIPVLLEGTLRHHGRSGLSPGVLKRLREHDWPGNVRELIAFVESYLILLGQGRDDEAMLANLLSDWCSVLSEGDGERLPGERNRMLWDAERDARLANVKEALEACGGNRKAAAKKLGISYNTLWRIMKG